MERHFDDEGMRRVQWAERKERMRREKQKQMLIRRVSRIVVPVVVVLMVILIIKGVGSIRKGKADGTAVAVGQGSASVAEGAKKDGRREPQADGEVQMAGGLGESQAAGMESGTDGLGEPQADGMESEGRGIGGIGIQAENQDSILADGEGMQAGNAGVQVNGTQASGGVGAGSGSAGSGAGKYASASISGDYKATGKTASPEEDVASSYVILVDIDAREILVRRDEVSRMNPASMTKVLTLLVAVEHIGDLDDTFTITGEIADYCYVNDCSYAGFEKGDTVTVRDLLYGTILPSGADAALGLATYVAGSHEAFVEMMNEKLKELGLSGSAHFTNCVGIYDDNHYCTIYDMAVIMENAVSNDLCREVLSAHTYTTSPTKRYPQGIDLSNWFLRRIEDKDTGGEVVCGKTGYVVQSGNCAVSYGEGKNGKRYICATANGKSGWGCIYDHVRMYKKYMG